MMISSIAILLQDKVLYLLKESFQHSLLPVCVLVINQPQAIFKIDHIILKVLLF